MKVVTRDNPELDKEIWERFRDVYAEQKKAYPKMSDGFLRWNTCHLVGEPLGLSSIAINSIVANYSMWIESRKEKENNKLDNTAFPYKVRFISKEEWKQLGGVADRASSSKYETVFDEITKAAARALKNETGKASVTFECRSKEELVAVRNAAGRMSPTNISRNKNRALADGFSVRTQTIYVDSVSNKFHIGITITHHNEEVK